MSFVKLENLNDFIQASTSCIKPVGKQSGTVAKVNDFSLSDCLACSGCITSAETVLVQQQNHDELFKIINENKIGKRDKTIVVSLSLQSIASFAARCSLPAQEAAERIGSFFRSIGCHKIYDINLARHLALTESYKEFRNSISASRDKKRFPIISSICPGWICYAEKTNGDLIIPHLSKVRSPQQIMGAMLKRHLGESGKKRSDIYHVTLMPCFDKKLEASRNDFKDSIDGTQDVDCVLTPVELVEILEEEGVTLLDFDPIKLDNLFDNVDQRFNAPQINSHFGSESGGYAENILLLEAANKLANESRPEDLAKSLEYVTFKNSDFIEVHLKLGGEESQTSDGQRLSKFAIVNGFRNIQTVVQRLKRNVLKYDYIEIMACPSGCLNGGAQCKSESNQHQASTILAARQAYKEVPKLSFSNAHDKDIESNLYSSLGLSNEQDIRNLLYTNFHTVPKMQNLTVNW